MKFSVERGYNQKHKIDYIKSCVESIGYILLSTLYENARSKLQMKCLKNHVFEVTWNNFSGKYGSRCPICWKEKNRGENHWLYGKGEMAPFYGKKRPNIKEKLSKSLKIAMNRPDVKQKLSKSLQIAMKRPDVILKKSGKNNPAWKGGIQCEPYCDIWLDRSYKRDIKLRDGNTCQNCGITEMLSLKVYGCYLSLHHIDYVKKNCNMNNLITLCVSCNFKSNSNRNLYTERYQSIMIKKYNFNYNQENFHAS